MKLKVSILTIIGLVSIFLVILISKSVEQNHDELQKSTQCYLLKDKIMHLTEKSLTEPLKSRQNNPTFSTKEQKSKLRGGLIEKLDKMDDIEKVDVRVTLAYDASEEKFENKLSEVNIVYDKIKFRTYGMSLNQNQIELVASLVAVMLISDPEDPDSQIAVK